jgi:hypothetical protein
MLVFVVAKNTRELPGIGSGRVFRVGCAMAGAKAHSLSVLYGPTEEAAEKDRVVPVLGPRWFIFSFRRGYWVRFY